MAPNHSGRRQRDKTETVDAGTATRTRTHENATDVFVWIHNGLFEPGGMLRKVWVLYRVSRAFLIVYYMVLRDKFLGFSSSFLLWMHLKLFVVAFYKAIFCLGEKPGMETMNTVAQYNRVGNFLSVCDKRKKIV